MAKLSREVTVTNDKRFVYCSIVYSGRHITLFRSIRDSLSRTRQSVFGQIVNVFGAGEITDETWEDVEALLIQADMGVPTTLQLVDALRQRA
jgi:signal recognition particle GTPase